MSILATMRTFAIFALLAGSTAYHIYKLLKEEQPQSVELQPVEFRPRQDLGQGFDSWSDGQSLRMRGSYQDIMRTLNPSAHPAPPPLPTDLDVSNLPKYWGGCPHCGATSMFGENQWRYHELERTRGHYDNTTTYLVKCQKCQGFMRATVDHDD